MSKLTKNQKMAAAKFDAAKEDKLRWLKDIHEAFAKYNIGHALWNYKEKDFGIVKDNRK